MTVLVPGVEVADCNNSMRVNGKKSYLNYSQVSIEDFSSPSYFSCHHHYSSFLVLDSLSANKRNPSSSAWNIVNHCSCLFRGVSSPVSILISTLVTVGYSSTCSHPDQTYKGSSFELFFYSAHSSAVCFLLSRKCRGGEVSSKPAMKSFHLLSFAVCFSSQVIPGKRSLTSPCHI